MTVKRIIIAAAPAMAMWLAACGGTQTTDQVQTDETETETEVAVVVPTGPSPEEIAAQQQTDAEQAFITAAELYTGFPPGQRDLDRIAQLLQRAIDIHPSRSCEPSETGEPTWSYCDALFNLGLVRAEQGDEAGALDYYRQATDADPTYARGLANVGYLQLQRGDVAGAVRTFEECIARKETEPGCNINLALLYEDGSAPLADPTQSLEAAMVERLRFALGGEARNADAYANLASIYFEQGRLELARMVCENAILLGIDDAVLHNRLGLVALAQDDVIEAYGEFQRAVQLDPTYVEAHMNIGAMALSFRDYDQALAAFETVLADRQDDLDARLSYGAALRGVDEFDQARTEYEAILAVNPNHTGALYNMALLSQEATQNYPEACQYYVRYLDSAGPSGNRYDDAERRLTNLHDLLASIVAFGEATEEDVAACTR